MLSPSYMCKEVQEEVPQFSNLMALALSNLLELKGNDDPDKAGPNLRQFIEFLKTKKIDEAAFKEHSSSKWHITDANITDEMDRSSAEQVSFYFVLRWLRHDVGKIKRDSKYDEGQLLSVISDRSRETKNLKSVDELLAMCYFKYLESSEFIGLKTNYLYGDLLEQNSDFEESILLMLEMLRIYFPAGQPIDVP